MIIGLQLLTIAFAGLMVYFAMINYKKADLLKSEFLLWVFVWTAVVAVTLFPDVLRRYSYELFFTRLFDLLVIGGFIFLVSFMSIIYMKLKKLDERLTKMIRQDAIEKPRKK